MKNKKLLPLFLTPVALLMLTGCPWMQPINPDKPDKPDTPDVPDIPVIVDDNPVIEDSEEYNTFWNPSTELSINIEMSQAAAEFIDTYQSDHNDSTYFDYYVPCTVIIEMNSQTYTFEEVGIRQKGNMSRTSMLYEGNFSMYRLAHYKLSFKETFDDEEYTTISQLQPFAKTWEDSAARKARKKRTLFDMEKIDIKWNRNDDLSKSKQSYALKQFRDHGVLAGHDTLAPTTIGITGKDPIYTTYEVLECIDSVFIKRHFSEEFADGDLYKCTYTDRGPANMSKNLTIGNQIGVEDNKTGFHPSYDLKTNKKKNTTHTNLFNLFNVVNDKTSTAAEFKTKLEKVFDVKSFLMYESIAFLLGNFDDMRNNANNYYMYFTSGENPIAFVIPYDFDRCLGAGCEGRQEYMTNFSAESTKMQCNGSWQALNIYWRTICTSTDNNSQHKNVERVEAYRALYQKNIEDLLNNGDFSNSSFTSYVNSFPLAYRGQADGSGTDNVSFNEYLTRKISKIKECNPSYDIKVS